MDREACSTPVADGDLAVAADGLRQLALTLDQRRRHYGLLAGVRDTDLLALVNLVADGPLSSVELSRRLGVTPSSVTNLVDRLESDRLVARQDDPADRRRLCIVVTERGEDAVRRARSWSLDALQTIDPDRLPAVVEALRELGSALKLHQESVRRTGRRLRGVGDSNPGS